MSAEDTSDSRPVPTLPGYEVTALRNSTSSSDVWEATQISLDRPVTIATLRPELLADPVAPAHFDELSRAFARLHHSQTPRRSAMTANTPGASRSGLTRGAGEGAGDVPALDHAVANSFVATLA